MTGVYVGNEDEGVDDDELNGVRLDGSKVVVSIG